MATELKPTLHQVRIGEMTIEILHDGQLVGTVVLLEHDVGVKVISKYPLVVEGPLTYGSLVSDDGRYLREVRIGLRPQAPPDVEHTP